MKGVKDKTHNNSKVIHCESENKNKKIENQAEFSIT